MLKLLLPVDGSAGAERAVRHVAALAKLACPLDIHLLNVQPAADAWEVKRFLREEEIANLQTALAQEAMQTARAILDQAGVAYTQHPLVGDVAPTIADFAKTQGCDQIVMGTRGNTALEGLLLGSVSTKVLHLVQVPVTLVK